MRYQQGSVRANNQVVVSLHLQPRQNRFDQQKTLKEAESVYGQNRAGSLYTH